MTQTQRGQITLIFHNRLRNFITGRQLGGEKIKWAKFIFFPITYFLEQIRRKFIAKTDLQPKCLLLELYIQLLSAILL